MSCEFVEKIGTGDCELTKNCKSDIKLADNLASDLVVEILENALDIADDPDEKPCKLSGDVMDTLSCKFQDMKLSENLNSPEALLCNVSLKGLGDQLKVDDDTISDEPVKHPPVEKKNRLTDLVKNSKQILSKLMLSDSTHQVDIKNEKVLKVVDLDSKEHRFKSRHSVNPETIPIPPSDSSEILNEGSEKLSDNGQMDDVELASSSFTNTTEEIRAKTMTFPLAGPSGPPSSFLGRYRTLKFPEDVKHKKWNIGSKIMKYIKKKGQNRKSDGKESKPSNGVEITPKDDEF